MLTLLYSPHMTSVDNEAKRASGHADVPLSDAGRARALTLGEHYRNEHIDAVYTSDLQRAVLTGRLAFAGRDLPQFADGRLRECDYGQMTQAPTAQVEAEFPRRIREPFPDGESVVMVAARVGALLADLLKTYDDATLVLIGHKATKFALHFWCTADTLEAAVTREWEWLDVPAWRYTCDAAQWARKAQMLD